MKIESAHYYKCPFCAKKKIAKIECEEGEVVVIDKFCNEKEQPYWLMLSYGQVSTKKQQLHGIPFTFIVSLDDPYERKPAHVATEFWRGNILEGGMK